MQTTAPPPPSAHALTAASAPPCSEIEREALDLLSRAHYGRLAASRHALPFVSVARHALLDDGSLLLRMHRGWNIHTACDGSVVAYQTDNVGHAEEDGEGWAVEFVGKARVTEPGPALLERLGALPGTVNGRPYDPVFLRIEPHFVTRNRLTQVDEPGWGEPAPE